MIVRGCTCLRSEQRSNKYVYIYTFLFILAYYYSTIDKYHTTNNNIYIIIIIVMAIVIGMSDAFTLSAQKARTRICYQCEKYSM